MGAIEIKVGDMIEFEKLVPGKGFTTIKSEVVKVDETKFTLQSGDVFHLWRRIN